ncbi:MAG: mannose-1-phosphate guanylyltransferase [bacterium]
MAQTFAVIMAGGIGSRFWPRSREKTPKQLLEIIGEGTMIENSLARIEPLAERMNTFIVTNKAQYENLLKQVPFLPKENILIEPIGRNTAPCIGLAALWIQHIDPNALMLVLPADHLVRDTDEFVRILYLALKVAEEQDALVTIGIKPTRPETGYGYIQIEEEEHDRNQYRSDGVYRVKTFAEKPNLETAQQFLDSGDFLWNSGMFMWKADVILRQIEQHLPEMYEILSSLKKHFGLPTYKSALQEVYSLIRGISIDYGVMEKANNVYVVKGDFGWSDIGSWDEVVRLTPKDDNSNSFRGKVIPIDSKNNYIDAGSKLVATVGVEDLIIINTDDAILVCRKGQSQDVKEIIDYMRRKQMNEYF